jgi:small-conductance mechanosensitive channel
MGKPGRRKDPVVHSVVHSAVLYAARAAVPVYPPKATLATACGTYPGIACRFAWDVTHSTRAAELTKVFFAGPARVGGQIAFVLLIAVILRIAAHRVIERLAKRAADNAASQTARAGSAFRDRLNPRASALGSVLSNAASVTIFGIAGAIILGDMGVNLAPVLASAGVLGIAIGFGAQNLVQDFLAGIFMLLEDQYGVGDVIDIGAITGTVEAVSLRITRIRDVKGVVWYIRNGTISQAGNESQGWARAVVDFPVAYDRDIPRVRRLMTSTAMGMWQEPRWHEVILEEPTVWGVQAVATDEVVVRLAARTAPLRQWEVARELRERVKNALDAAGHDDQATGAGGTAAGGTEAAGSEGGGSEGGGAEAAGSEGGGTEAGGGAGAPAVP